MSKGAEAEVIKAAGAWARALEAVTEAEEQGHAGDNELQAFQTAEFELYQAVLKLRRPRPPN